MATVLTADLFVSVDGWAGSDGLPAYFGYLGPELQEWIASELAAPQLVLMGRRTYDSLAAIPDEARGESAQRMDELDKVVFSALSTRRPGPTPGSAREMSSTRSGG